MDEDEKMKYRKHDKPRVFVSLDLEMNQPSCRIIQIGAVVGNVVTGEIFDEKFSMLVECGEPLCTETDRAENKCDIPKLTGITDEKIRERGVSLFEAYEKLKEYCSKYEAARTLITWGAGDVVALKCQLERDYPDTCDWSKHRFPFGFRVLDIKTLHQAWAVVNDVSIKAGLAKAMSKHSLLFRGRAHDAMWDAHNTFVIAHHLFIKLNEG